MIDPCVNSFTSHPLSIFKYCPVCGSIHFNEHNSVSKKCDECGFTYYFNPRGATVAFIRNEKNELLVATRGKEPAKGTLDLPGGFLECFETAEEGVKREVLEETGITIEKVKYLFSLPNIYPYSGLNVHTIDLFFECVFQVHASIKAMDDVASLQWIPLDSINPKDFGLSSVRKGIVKYLELLNHK